MNGFPTLTENVILSCLNHRNDNKKMITFYKGKDYYQNHRVFDIVFNNEKSIFSAKVRGSYGAIWSSRLVFRDGILQFHSCDCPSHANYGGPCKHQIALMFCIEKMREEEKKSEEKRMIVCTECKNQYESSLALCPVCGCPTEENI